MRDNGGPTEKWSTFVTHLRQGFPGSRWILTQPRQTVKVHKSMSLTYLQAVKCGPSAVTTGAKPWRTESISSTRFSRSRPTDIKLDSSLFDTDLDVCWVVLLAQRRSARGTGRGSSLWAGKRIENDNSRTLTCLVSLINDTLSMISLFVVWPVPCPRHSDLVRFAGFSRKVRPGARVAKTGASRRWWRCGRTKREEEAIGITRGGPLLALWRRGLPRPWRTVVYTVRSRVVRTDEYGG